MTKGLYCTANGVYTTATENRPALAFHTYSSVYVCVFPRGSHSCMSGLLTHHPDRAKLLSSPSVLLVKSCHILPNSL